jgi:F-type H+-transporting ATPase subunit delta
VANERPSQAYAQAIFEKALAGWLSPLKAVAASLAQSKSIEKLDDASVPFATKQEMLRAVVPHDASAEVQNLLFLLASRNEMHLLPHVIGEVDQYAKRDAAVVSTKVTSAVPLTDSERESLESKLRKQFGSQLAFEYSVNPEILGGVIVRAGDKVIDGSVAGKLAALKEKLK